MAESKYYYHVLTEDEKKQRLTSDYLVSDKVKATINENVMHSSVVKDKYGRDYVRNNGQKLIHHESHDIFGSIVDVKTYMYGLDKKFNPGLINKALDIFVSNRLKFGYDFTKSEIFKDDKTSAEILNYIGLCISSSNNPNLIPTFTSFRYDEKYNKMFDFLIKKDFDVIKIKAGKVTDNIDAFGYNDTSAIREDGGLTFFYNHIDSERIKRKEIVDNFGRSLSVVSYVSPIELDLLDAFETPIVDEEEYKKLFEVVKKVIKFSHISEEFRYSIIFLLNNYYCLGQANPSYKSLYYLATQTSKFSLTDLIGAKKTIIDIMRFYKEKDDDTFDLFNTNITEKIGPSLILESDYFKRNKYII